MKNTLFLLLLVLTTLKSFAQSKEVIDGSRFYDLPAKSVDCTLVECPKIYAGFKGIWTGDFQSYDQLLKTFRPVKNKVIYDGNCYQNLKNGDIFIVGLKIDVYPEFNGQSLKTDTSFLITGMSGDTGSPFLRTIDKANGVIQFKKVFEDKPTEMSIWEYDMAKTDTQPEMNFRIIDFRNVANEARVERFVTISMKVGPAKQPYWEGVLVKGSHSRN
jgi:hypothetical protein